MGEDDVRRIGRELMAKARYVPLENYEYRLHVIARGYSGSRLQDIEVVTLGEMPFITKGLTTTQ